MNYNIFLYYYVLRPFHQTRIHLNPISIISTVRPQSRVAITVLPTVSATHEKQTPKHSVILPNFGEVRATHELDRRRSALQEPWQPEENAAAGRGKKLRSGRRPLSIAAISNDGYRMDRRYSIAQCGFTIAIDHTSRFHCVRTAHVASATAARIS